ncbi:hypothetical protein ACP4OV_000458 [Aristida adscensionis]
MALRRINPRRRPLLLGPRAFSSSSSSDPPFPPPPPPPQPPQADGDGAASPSPPPPSPGAARSPAHSLFNDIRERLQSSKSQATPPPPRRIPMDPPRPGFARPSASLEEITRTLQSFRASVSGGAAASSSTPGFEGLIKSNPGPGATAGRNAQTFDSIRAALKLSPQPQQRPNRSPEPFMSSLRHSIFSKEMGEMGGKAEGTGKETGIELGRSYSYEELGKRLSELRPTGAGKDGEGFSLEELQGRIAKLVKLEMEEDKNGGRFLEIRKGLESLKHKAPPGSGRMPMALMAGIGGQSLDFLHMPPQEQLLERYFHPDHMSSEEKMKLELQRVRDEFKMSENDCGSARVQIAQLTVKIKHLSAVLHKKDKHSRKGLQEMVQRRKKYLKYLRRTDWDSYCLVLSKLGLRDVPEYKAPDYKSKSTTKAKAKKKSKSKGKRKMKA